MKNTMGDLNNHLFAQLERLSDEDLKGEQLEEEIRRADAIYKTACAITQNAALVIKAAAVYDGLGDMNEKKPKMLEG